jgi:salicylate hydroxylase
LNIAIAGAGIAGLASALALAKANPQFPINVFERQATPTALGAGIQLGPNAFAALRAIDLELWEQIKNRSLKPSRLVMRDLETGRVLSTLALGQSIERAFGQPYGVMHRATLQTALVAYCKAQPNLQLHFGTAFVPNASSDLNVIADGLWSSHRLAIAKGVEPKLSSIAFRGLVDADHNADDLVSLSNNDVQLWVGPRAHVVVYPINHPRDGRRVMNVAAFISGQRMKALDASLPQRDRTSWATTLTPTQLMSALPRLNDKLGDLLAQTQEVSAWRVFAGAQLGTWFKDSMVLIGDAAHAMLPHLAQGAAFALEDAACLAKHIGEMAHKSERQAALSQGLALALQSFQTERLARCHRAQNAAVRYQRIYHATGIVRFARNQVLAIPFLTPEFGGLRWVYEKGNETENGTSES